MMRNITSIEPVETIMTRDVVYIDGEKTAYEATKLMSKRNISSLIVGNKENLEGVLCERNIIWKVLAEGLDPKKIKVKDIKSIPIIWIYAHTPIYEVHSKMCEEQVRHLVVKKSEKVVGIISVHDLIWITAKEAEEVY
ncbi:MAG: CBS domain-containing protein [bacterium]|nr:CBS domain-containing protein [bacterium]